MWITCLATVEQSSSHSYGLNLEQTGIWFIRRESYFIAEEFRTRSVFQLCQVFCFVWVWEDTVPGDIGLKCLQHWRFGLLDSLYHSAHVDVITWFARTLLETSGKVYGLWNWEQLVELFSLLHCSCLRGTKLRHRGILVIWDGSPFEKKISTYSILTWSLLPF